MGTLMNSPARHEIHCVSTPPRTSPRLPPAPATALYQAMARVRSAPSRKVTVRSASVDGAAIAAPTPWIARAASSQPADWASPAASEAAVNRAIPATNTRRRPRMSPARAPSRSRPPKVSA